SGEASDRTHAHGVHELAPDLLADRGPSARIDAGVTQHGGERHEHWRKGRIDGSEHQRIALGAVDHNPRRLDGVRRADHSTDGTIAHCAPDLATRVHRPACRILTGIDARQPDVDAVPPRNAVDGEYDRLVARQQRRNGLHGVAVWWPLVVTMMAETGPASAAVRASQTFARRSP